MFLEVIHFSETGNIAVNTTQWYFQTRLTSLKVAPSSGIFVMGNIFDYWRSFTRTFFLLPSQLKTMPYVVIRFECTLYSLGVKFLQADFSVQTEHQAWQALTPRRFPLIKLASKCLWESHYLALCFSESSGLCVARWRYPKQFSTKFWLVSQTDRLPYSDI